MQVRYGATNTLFTVAPALVLVPATPGTDANVKMRFSGAVHVCPGGVRPPGPILTRSPAAHGQATPSQTR